MSVRYRNVDVCTWDDEKVRELSPMPPSGLGLWLFLLTNRFTTNIPGLFSAGEAAMAEKLRWPLEAFRECFGEVFGKGMARADWNAPLVWLPNALKKRNRPSNPNVVLGWADTWDELPDCALKREARRRLRAFIEPLGKGFLEAFDRACPNGTPDQEQEQEQEQEGGSRARARDPGGTEPEPVPPRWPAVARGGDREATAPAPPPPAGADLGAPAARAAADPAAGAPAGAAIPPPAPAAPPTSAISLPGPPAAARRATAPPPKRLRVEIEPDEAFARALELWGRLWREQYQVDYVDNERDHEAIGALLRIVDGRADYLEALFVGYLGDHDAYLLRTKHPLGTLHATVNKYRARAPRPRPAAASSRPDPAPPPMSPAEKRVLERATELQRAGGLTYEAAWARARAEAQAGGAR